ncbi:hypothetical protein GH714_030538 [Hevea brasiliensis]|uniref:SCP domain-containing protein n=1 Tax=Hevea brasiliensis TaxID=3981 RepID=A0A6A6N5P9_HEVBR|nr:hypothetical protein GH714_030538 [Hevea brasiliensis]
MGFISKFVAALCMMGLTLASISLAQNCPQDYVAAHNIYRSEAGVGPLTWNIRLADYAQNYANSKTEDCELVHSNGPYGENLAEGSGELTGEDAVKLWADEKPYYDYASNTCVGDQCLHYTHVVWRNTHQSGPF